MIRLSTLAYSTRLQSKTFALFNFVLVFALYLYQNPGKCQRATASDLPFNDIFAPQKVPFLKIYDDVIACDLWFGPRPQSKILATSMLAMRVPTFLLGYFQS